MFKTYLFYASILVGKMLIMSPLTARWRFRKGVSQLLFLLCYSEYACKTYVNNIFLQVFATPEDTVLRKDSKVKHDDDVERVRR